MRLESAGSLHSRTPPRAGRTTYSAFDARASKLKRSMCRTQEHLAEGTAVMCCDQLLRLSVRNRPDSTAMGKLIARRHDATGRSTSRPANSRLANRLGPPKGEPWCWLTKEMVSTTAFRSLDGNALQALFRVLVEHMAHAGTENGNLVVTYDDFAAWGIRRPSVSKALEDLKRAGLLRVVVQGGRSYGGARVPSRYRLTWLPTAEGQAATNEWKAFNERNSPGTNSCPGPDTKT